MTPGKSRILLFCIITSLYWFAFYAYVPTLPTYAASLGASYKMVGLIIGSYGFVQMILRIPLGILSDRLNKRKLFVILGLVGGLVSSLGMWLFKSPEAFLIFRSSAGAAAAAWVTFTVLFSSYFDAAESPKALGYLNSFTVLGQVTATFLGGIAAEKFGPQAPFLLAFLGAAAGIVLSFAATEKTVEREPLHIKALLAVGRDRNLLIYSILAIFIQFLIFSTMYGFTPVAASKLGAGDFQLGVLATLSALPGVFASALSGSFFLKRYGEKKTLVWGFVLSALACFTIPYAGSVYTLYITQVVSGFCAFGITALLMGLCIKSVATDKRATAMGFFQAIYGIGMFVGPAIVGFLNDTAGLAAGFWVTGFVGIAGAVVSGLYAQGKA